ncbi:MAG: hypothetical protein CL610_12160 [Anaerolineaceae bacterium]|nr:hypothetical protein [Anaerolineaceae bacterium]
MQFALNYSPPAAALLADGKIEIDLFKCPDWPDMIEQAGKQRPVYVHFPLVAGQQNVGEVGLEQVARLRASTCTPFVNTHIGARYQDLADPEDADAAVEHMLRDVRPLVDHFGADSVMAENIPYPDIFQDKPAIDVLPNVICRVIQESGCGLLLDTAHARLAADSLEMDVYAYIERLPVDRLREVHVTGVGLNREGIPEDHLPMTDDDWELFGWVLDNIHRGRWPAPRIVACEYGGIGPMFDWRTEPDVIAQDIPRMYAMVHQR